MSDNEDGVSSSTDPVVTTSADAMETASSTDDLVVGIKSDLHDDDDISSSTLTLNSTVTVAPSLPNPALQSLLASPINLTSGQILAHPDAIQIITVSSPSDLIPSQADAVGRVWQVVNPEMAIIAVDPNEFDHKPLVAGVDGFDDQNQVVSSDMVHDTVASILMAPPLQPLPPNCPNWAARLKNCEVIGDYYRGYVDSEVELDLLLTYHKQQTMSFWGTRQSPSPAKPSTRLMWKSQYVPWDGVPFVNSGSRAVVMECQYGPRRKGNIGKKHDEALKGEFKQTCPARIYIKKVKKFPEFQIDMNLDKKSMKNAMDKAFHELKQRGLDSGGHERYYVQLPTDKAHQFHDETAKINTPKINLEEDEAHRLNPKVVDKIRELVAGGEVRVYAIRKQLRQFVTREMFQGADTTLQRHDLTLFPTVNDLKNQIHQALKDIENGTLPLTAPTVNVEIVSSAETAPTDSSDLYMVEQGLFQQQPAIVTSEGPVPETVTVTLTQNPGEDGSHVISRIETHLSDGTTQISTQLTQETAQLLARLNPNMFPPGSLVQLQSAPPTDSPEQDINSGQATLNIAQQQTDLNISQDQTGLVVGQVQNNMSVGPEQTNLNLHHEQTSLNLHSEQNNLNIGQSQNNLNIKHEQMELDINSEQNSLNIGQGQISLTQSGLSEEVMQQDLQHEDQSVHSAGLQILQAGVPDSSHMVSESSPVIGSSEQFISVAVVPDDSSEITSPELEHLTGGAEHLTGGADPDL